MANYGFDDLKVYIDDSDSTEREITSYVTEISPFIVEAILEDAHTAGDSWVEKLFTGLKAGNEFTITGFYDDTASTGPVALMDSIGDTRTFKVLYGSTKYSTCECLIKSFDCTPGRGELTKFTCTLQPTSTVTEN